MRTLRLLLVTACIVVAGFVNVDAAAGQDLPTLERGDTGSGVELWQEHLGQWLAYARPALRITDERGTFGAGTERATIEFQRFVGLRVADGVVDERTWGNLFERLGVRAALLLRRSDAVTPAWPIPVPQWYWAWARWYLGHGEFRDRARDPAVRPAAPRRIPDWGWRRMHASTGESREDQAVRLVQDRVRAIFRAELRMPPTVRQSELTGGWILVANSLVGHDQGTLVAWLRLVDGRWVPWNLGRWFPEEPDRPQVNPEPRFVPCDLLSEAGERQC